MAGEAGLAGIVGEGEFGRREVRCDVFPGEPAPLLPFAAGACPVGPAHAEVAATIASMTAAIVVFPVVCMKDYSPGVNSSQISGVSWRTIVTPCSCDHPSLTKKYL